MASSATGGTDGSEGERDSAANRVELDRQIEAALARVSGGERVGANQVVWEDEGAVLTLPMPGEQVARAAGERDSWLNCKKGRVCLFQDAKWAGARLSFYKCKFQKLRKWNWTNVVSSWVNNQTGDAYAQLS